MKVKNLNHSSTKTKNLIRKTFAELMKEKHELSKVTVSELVKRADINRGTFYNHYDSIYDVAEEFESEIIRVLFENTKNITSINDIFNSIDYIVGYLKENENTYRLLLSSKEPLLFLKKLNKAILERLNSIINSHPEINKSKELEFDLSLFTDGIVNQVLKYFNGTSKYTLDEISKYTKKILAQFFKNSINI